MAFPQLPPGFTFGTSTAAYQIEGTADITEPSVWDTFCARPGTITDGSDGSTACDHYHRMPDDVALLRDLGVGGYRFAISWPRVRSGAKGLDFYDRLVDRLLACGIAPMATLFHWDLPQALQDEGGWASRATVDAFEEYTALVASRLIDRVAYWCPVNEPNVVALYGHAVGLHAPGIKDLGTAFRATHHLLLGHGRAVNLLRAAGATQIGCAWNVEPSWPASQAAEDIEAATAYDTVWNRLYCDPVLLGSYPEELVDEIPVMDTDLDVISTPLDFFGVNYYNPQTIGAPLPETEEGGPGSGDASFAGNPAESSFGALPFSFRQPQGYPTTEFGWPVVPGGLYEAIMTLRQRYPDLPPIHITENGCSFTPVSDQFRIDYLEGHLRAVGRAIEDGADVRGYWTWSFLDNFEWGEGYTQRFGLVHVDFETLVRTPRESYAWYRDLIAAQQR